MKSWVVRGMGIVAVVVVFGAGGGCEGSGTLSGTGGGSILLGAAGSGAATGLGGTGNCGCCDHEVRTWRLPPDIMIVLDTAATMNDALDASGSKWAAASAGINMAVDAAPFAASWGLAFMGSESDACDTGDRLPVGSNGSFRLALADRSDAGMLAGAGNRPTRAALDLTAAYLSGRGLGAHRIMVLVTDGLPNCGAGASDALADDTAGALRAVKSAADEGILTSVVGLATAGGPADATLNQMATLGGLGRTASPAYVPASSAADLANALNDLVTRFADCTFAIPPPPTNDGSTSREVIAISIKGTRLPRERANGWDYTDGTARAMQLFGGACDAVRADPTQVVTVIFLCHGGP